MIDLVYLWYLPMRKLYTMGIYMTWRIVPDDATGYSCANQQVADHRIMMWHCMYMYGRTCLVVFVLDCSLLALLCAVWMDGISYCWASVDERIKTSANPAEGSDDLCVSSRTSRRPARQHWTWETTLQVATHRRSKQSYLQQLAYCVTIDSLGPYASLKNTTFGFGASVREVEVTIMCCEGSTWWTSVSPTCMNLKGETQISTVFEWSI